MPWQRRFLQLLVSPYLQQPIVPRRSIHLVDDLKAQD